MLHAEILAIEMEIVNTAGARLQSVRIEKLPGSTSLHGASKLAHKTCLILWGLFLTHANSLVVLREVLKTFRWIVSDQGVESGMCDAVDCTASFWHWASGRSAADVPPICEAEYILPRAI